MGRGLFYCSRAKYEAIIVNVCVVLRLELEYLQYSTVFLAVSSLFKTWNMKVFFRTFTSAFVRWHLFSNVDSCFRTLTSVFEHWNWLLFSNVDADFCFRTLTQTSVLERWRWLLFSKVDADLCFWTLTLTSVFERWLMFSYLPTFTHPFYPPTYLSDPLITPPLPAYLTTPVPTPITLTHNYPSPNYRPTSIPLQPPHPHTYPFLLTLTTFSPPPSPNVPYRPSSQHTSLPPTHLPPANIPTPSLALTYHQTRQYS